MTSPTIVGTGLVALDLIYGEGLSTPIRRSTGGTCGNVLAILRFLEWHSVPLARLAPDRARALIEADLARWDIETQFIDLAPQKPTPIIVERIRREPPGSHSFSWTCPSCGAWLPRYSPVPVRSAESRAAEIPAPAVFFFDRPSPGAIALAKHYSNAGALVVFEPSAKGDPGTFQLGLEIAGIVKYSDERFAALPRHAVVGPQLEIQTLGARGLRYRFTTGRRPGPWRTLDGIAPGRIVDTAGSGDWCMAGLLKKLVPAGPALLTDWSESDIRDALRYGQVLGSWNCRFAGARGGMYERSREEFEQEIASLDGLSSESHFEEVSQLQEDPLRDICPSCPAEPAGGGAFASEASH